MTDKQIKKYCDGLDCAICNEKEPCIYKIANELEEKLLAKEKECEELTKNYFTVIQQRNKAEQTLTEIKELCTKHINCEKIVMADEIIQKCEVIKE